MPSKLRQCFSVAIAIISILPTTTIIYAGELTYIYDELNRLKQATYDDGTIIQYIYDGVGNRGTTE